VKHGPIKLVAMADVFSGSAGRQRQEFEHEGLADEWTCRRPPVHSFDAYKNAMDCLRPGDIVIFATVPAFRWVHFGYAIEKG